MKSNSNILSRDAFSALLKRNRRLYGLSISRVGREGHSLDSDDPVLALALLRAARRYALIEAERWGEPYVYFLCSGVVSWMVPVCDRSGVLGGVTGGCVMSEPGQSGAEAIRSLVEAGAARSAAVRFVEGLPVWPQKRIWQAASDLFKWVYELPGLDMKPLERSREAALQQRQIAEAIHARKGHESSWLDTLERERHLLSLIRVGDRNGARAQLNDMLASMFLRSPNRDVLKARAVEMLGALVRSAVQDNPEMSLLLERQQRWIGELIGAASFEEVCTSVREALDEFIDAVHLQGFNRTDSRVTRALGYLARHFVEHVKLADVAKAASLSEYRLAHLIKQTTGMTVMQHLRRLRVRRACELLERTGMAIADIAYEVGYSDQSYFTQQFRVVTGTTPRRYRLTFEGRS